MALQKNTPRTVVGMAKWTVFASLALVVLLGLGSSEAVYAQNTAYWDGSDNRAWEIGNNWISGPVSGVTTAVFDSNATANRDTTVNSSYAAGSIVFAVDVPGKITVGGTGVLTLFNSDINCLDTDFTHEISVRLRENDGDINANVSSGGTLEFSGQVDLTTHGLNKNGGGELILSGTNTYTGGTSVTDGQLTLNGGAALADDGAVTLGASGTLALGADETIGSLAGTGTVNLNGHNLSVASTIGPGNSIGTLTINGDFTIVNGSTTEIEVNDAGQCDVLAINGSATIESGTTLKAIPLDAIDLDTLHQYKFMTTTTGITGEFTILDTALLDFNASVQGNDYYITVGRAPFISVAQTQNQRRIATYLERTYSGATGDYQTVLSQITGLATDADVRGAMGQLDGELFPTLSIANLQAASNFNQVIADRLRANLGPGGGFGGFAASEKRLNDTVVRAQDGCCDDCDCTRWNSWFAGYGLGGHGASDNDAHGYTFGTGGMVLGIDRQLNDKTRFGLLYGNGFASTRLNGLVADSSINSHVFGLYSKRYDDNNGYTTTIADIGFDNYNSSRHVTFGAIDRFARSKHNGWQATFYQETGRMVPFGQHFCYQPYQALQYIYIRQNDFTETGANSIDLQVPGEDLNSLRTLLGARLIARGTHPWLHGAELAFRTHWMHELLDQTTGVVTPNLTGGGMPGFDVRGVDLGRDWVVMGPDLMWQYNAHVQLRAAYDLTFNACQTYHTGGGSLTFLW